MFSHRAVMQFCVVNVDKIKSHKMQRLIALDPETTTGKSKDLFNAIQNKLGMVPNMMRTMGNSPAVLNGYLSLNAALSEGKLGAKLGELIALTIANANSCEYCNAAHSFIGEKLVQVAEEWWKKGGIPTIMWHWGAPAIGNGYENSKKEIDIDKIFEKGTPQYKAFWKELDEKAQLLEKLNKAHVPILWRPFHELNGSWFWWGKKGPEQFKRLWITMYNYYVHKKHLDNLIWVLCYMDRPDSAWYPGRKYVDIAGADTYRPEESRLGMYQKTRSIVGDVMPIAFHECGIPPDPTESFAQGAKWSWFMEWHTDFLKKVPVGHLRYVYNNDLVITLDKVPVIMAVYGKGLK